MLCNPFSSIYEKLNTGSGHDRYLMRPDFPWLLDIELTNHCNFFCRMCETGMRSSTRSRGYMQLETYERILTEAVAHNAALRFIRWGEPTLHPHWLEWMRMAKHAGLMVHFNTNGSLLNAEEMQNIIDADIDSVKFSFQGVDAASYQEMRQIDFFDKLLAKINLLKSMRKDRNNPWIHISTTITNETAAQIEAFKAIAVDIADYVNVGLTYVEKVSIDKIAVSEQSIQYDLVEKQAELKKRKACPEVFGKLSIDWDGSITACCSDNCGAMILGNIHEQRIAELWKSKKQQYFQKILAEDGFDKLSLCKHCYATIGD